MVAASAREDGKDKSRNGRRTQAAAEVSLDVQGRHQLR